MQNINRLIIYYTTHTFKINQKEYSFWRNNYMSRKKVERSVFLNRVTCLKRMTHAFILYYFFDYALYCDYT